MIRAKLRAAVLGLAVLSLGSIAVADFVPSNTLYLGSSGDAPNVYGTFSTLSYNYSSGLGHLSATGDAERESPNGVNQNPHNNISSTGSLSLNVYFNSQGEVITSGPNSPDLIIKDVSNIYFQSADLTQFAYHFSSNGGNGYLGQIQLTFGNNGGVLNNGGNIALQLVPSSVMASAPPSFGSMNWSDELDPMSNPDPYNAWAVAPLPNSLLGGLGLFSLLALVGLQRRRAAHQT